MSLSEHIAEQARQVDRRPTEPQKAAGNYRKGHVRLHGLEIAIENPCGSFREGKGPDGKVWRCRLPAHYGYFKGSEGADGDHVDVFIGPHHKSQLAYVIDQHDHRTAKYDEAKVMLGFVSPTKARRTYMEAFSDGKGGDRIGALHEMTIPQLKDWLKDGDTKRPYKRADGGRVQPMPENTSSLEAQQKQLVEGNRHAQLFPGGKGELPLPKGMHRAKMDNGDVFHFNLKHTNIKKLKAASKAGRENEVLGLGPFSKHEVMARAMRGEHPIAVVERDRKGNEVRAAAGTRATAPTQAAHMAEGKSPGNTLAVEHPIHTLSKRRAAGGVAMADGGVPEFDDSSPVKPLSDQPVFAADSPVKPLGGAPSGGLASYLPDAITDIPHEAYESTANAVRGIGQSWNDIRARHEQQAQQDTSSSASFFDPNAFLGGAKDVIDTGKALLTGASLPFRPAAGAAESLIGHPMASAEHAVGTVINPAVAAHDNPQAMYEQAKSDVGTALSAARPAGMPVKVGGAYEWQAPVPAASKPVGVVKQPDTEDFFDAATNNYANMRGYGVEIDPKAMGQVADNIKTELLAEGYRPRNVPKVFDAIEELRTPAGQNHEISDIDSVRKVLGKARLDPSERDAARRAIGHIDDYLSNLGKNQQDVVVNPHFADRVAQEAQAARGNYAVAKRSEDIDEALEQADRQAARAGSGGNINNAIRQRLSSLRNNKRKMAGWTDDEKAELDSVINGTKGANAARAAGKFAPHGIVSTVMSAGAGHVLMPGIGEIAIPAGGWIAKKIGDHLTQAAATRLQNVVKARSPLGRQTSINAAAQSATANLAPPRRLPQIARAAMLPQVGSGIVQPLQRLYVGRGIQGPVPARADEKKPKP